MDLNDPGNHKMSLSTGNHYYNALSLDTSKIFASDAIYLTIFVQSMEVKEVGHYPVGRARTVENNFSYLRQRPLMP